MHLHSDKIFFPNSCHHSINTPWNVPKKIMNASSEPKRVNSLVPSVNFLILHIKSYHYQNTNNASFIVYVFQSQKYQYFDSANFETHRIQSQHYWYFDNATVMCIIDHRFVFLLSKMPMFQRAGMREGWLPPPVAFQ